MEKTNAAADPLSRAKTLVREGKFDAAEPLLVEALAAKKSPDAYRNLALVCRARGDYDRAAANLDEALTLDENDDAAIALMGELFLEQGDPKQAVGFYVLAIGKNPEQAAYKHRFVEIAGMIPFNKYNQMMADALLACLKTAGVDCARAQILWYTLLTSDPAFKDLYKFSNSGSYVTFNRKPFDKAENLKPLLTPFFVEGLRRIVVYHPVFEAFLTHLRLRISEDAVTERPKLSRADFTTLAAALAEYAFNTEYIFDTTAEEDTATAKLRQRLETEDAARQDAALVALFAMYAPLESLGSAAAIAQQHETGPLAGLVGQQITAQAELQKLREGVTALTEISGGVSSDVRGQYEEFPYPRWFSYSKQVADEETEGGLRGRKAKILVAGCGTGREAIQLAAALPDSTVLGVDLSRSSLSYAQRRANDEKISNVEFRQADILKLEASKGTFDYVSSSGVLHHMENPLDGWRVLTTLMKPEGLMRIALYSKLARRHLATAQAAALKGNYGRDAAGMRRFRRDTPKLLDRQVVQDIANRPDYYHLSMYRDLLFHVQEHCFDIAGIKSALETLGLEFIKFGVTDDTMALFRRRFSADKEGRSLDNWHVFEQENPDAFTHMYHFWCRRKS